MPHIHEAPGQHDLTASAFIFRTDGPNAQVLLHMHKKLNALLQFGGHVELDETPWQAVCHEVAEESGYDMSQLHIYQPKERIKALTTSNLHPLPVTLNTHYFDTAGNHRHIDICYAFHAEGEPVKPPVAGESADLRWFGREELLSVDASEIIENVREIALFIFDHVIDHWDEVSTAEFQR